MQQPLIIITLHQTCNRSKSDLDLGVQLSSNLSFSIHIENTVTAASKLVGWALRTFVGRGSVVMLTVFKNLIQPKLDYCSQLWSPSDQLSINKLESIQRKMVNSIRDHKLKSLNYWEKLQELQLYSQERRRERYMIVFLWKISQGLVSGYDLQFSTVGTRRGRIITPKPMVKSASTIVRNASERSLAVKGDRFSTYCLKA